MSFLPRAYGGRVNDEHITEHSGFLVPSDIVLADREFDIQESLGLKDVEVKIPSFSKRHTQMNLLRLRAHIILLMSEYMLNG